MPREQWPEDADFKRLLKEDWDERYGDRRQEMVFISLLAQMSEQDIGERLDACLERTM